MYAWLFPKTSVCGATVGWNSQDLETFRESLLEIGRLSSPKLRRKLSNGGYILVFTVFFWYCFADGGGGCRLYPWPRFEEVALRYLDALGTLHSFAVTRTVVGSVVESVDRQLEAEHVARSAAYEPLAVRLWVHVVPVFRERV